MRGCECSERVPASDTGFDMCVPTIKRVLVTVAADGSISHGPEETVYRTPTPFTTDEWSGKWIQDIAIRRLDDSGNYRVYFSIGGCGACDAEPNIYYLDDAGAPHLYYTVPRGELPVSSCEGLSDYWNGNFDFDADGELYLSSGSHCPAGLFHVPDTTADRAREDPVIVDEIACGILHFMVDTPSRYYFVGHRFEPVIYQRDHESDTMSVALEIPLSWLDPPTGSSPGIWLAGFDKMFGYMTPSRAPAMRGPSASSRAFRLPRAETRVPLQPEARFEGSLISRLPIPPRPDPNVSQPDLVMVGLETGKPTVKSDKLRVPLRVFVRNNGLSVKKPFKITVSARYSRVDEPIKGTFAVHGQRDKEQPELAQLHTGEVMAMGGILTLNYPKDKLLGAESVAITAVADDCQDTAIKTCRVTERNKKNNQMTIKLPLGQQ